MDDKKAKKSIAPILIGIVAILVIVGVVWFIVRKNGDNDGGNDSATTSEEDKTKVTAAELSKSPDETVAFGDYTAMFTLSKAIQNGEKVGAIVKVDGTVSHKISSYSIVQENPKKDEEGEMSQVGTVFVIQDAEAATYPKESADYPKDGQRIELTAKVVEVSPLNFQLVTLKDFVKVIK